MAQARLLYLDEDVPKRLAKELRSRGRNALSIYADGRKGTLDPDLIGVLAEQYGASVVLVTANESMPVEHEAVLLRTGLTLAVIDGVHANTHQDEWKRETVHRWAHLMAAQDSGTWRRYAPTRHGRWRRRTRQPQLSLI